MSVIIMKNNDRFFRVSKSPFAFDCLKLHPGLVCPRSEYFQVPLLPKEHIFNYR